MFSCFSRVIITMGKGLNLNVIAEGIETKEQLDILHDLSVMQHRDITCLNRGRWLKRSIFGTAFTKFNIEKRR
jgi:hypothetical protein